MYIQPFAQNRVHNAGHDKPGKIRSVQPQKPLPVPADHTHQPEGPQGDHDIPPRAVKPAIEHGVKIRILQGVEICLDHLPEEMQEEGRETEAYFWYVKITTFF